MENLKNGFLWGLGFGLAIMTIILMVDHFNPNEYEKSKNYLPTTVDNFEVTSQISRVEGSNFIIAGEFKLTEIPNFERYRIDVVIRNEKGLFLQQCGSDVDKRSVEVEKSFTKVVVCSNFSAIDSASLVEITLIGFK
jgi:hypothetical protein